MWNGREKPRRANAIQIKRQDKDRDYPWPSHGHAFLSHILLLGSRSRCH